MPNGNLILVFVHGWSVTNTNTYGGLPRRLHNEAAAAGMTVRIEEIFLGRYISFHDEVRVSDISRAFDVAVRGQLADIIREGTRFICITHSTGGPVIRDWWHRYYETVPGSGVCPMSHLIMLAPANFGSALAQLGKGRLSRLKFEFEGVEPGQGVLDWLELGSDEAWKLNTEWIHSDGSQIGPLGVFPFVLTGEYTDRSIFDHLNSYTGEPGSDGVVRVAAANLNSTYIRLVQDPPPPVIGTNADPVPNSLSLDEHAQAPRTALRVISHTSHSGDTMGIMRSVKEDIADEAGRETVHAILDCVKIGTSEEYAQLVERFRLETEAVQAAERVEIETHIFRSDTTFIHDKYSMVIFRVRDDEDHPVVDFDLILTAGPKADPNHLPAGFFKDRQRNSVNPETITYFFNRDMMKGTDEVRHPEGAMLREAGSGAEMLGFTINPRPDRGFVHYLPCEIKASADMLEKALHRNSTTLIDIRLRRIVHKNVFLVESIMKTPPPFGFEEENPDPEIV